MLDRPPEEKLPPPPPTKPLQLLPHPPPPPPPPPGGVVVVTVTVAVEVALCEPLAQEILYEVVVCGDTSKEPEVDVALVQSAEHVFALVDVHVRVEVAPGAMVSGFAVSVTETVGVPPPPPAGATVMVMELSAENPQSLETVTGTTNVPAVVGVPEIVLPEKESPAGKDDVPTINVGVELPAAVSV